MKPKHAGVFFILSAFLAVIVFSTLLLVISPVKAALVQLRNDQGPPNNISTTWKPQDIAGSVLTPLPDMYPVKIEAVDFYLFTEFPGAASIALVRACIYSITQGEPGSLLGCSSPTEVTTFYPNFASISLSANNIVIDAPNSFFTAVEYLSGTQGTIPSIVMDKSTFIQEGRNYYSLDAGVNWIEHYDFWGENYYNYG